MTPFFDTSYILPQPQLPPFEAGRQDYPSRELAKGDVLYRAGDPAEAAFYVEEGLLKQSIDLATGKERIVDLAGPGDIIGLTPPLAYYQDGAEALSPRVRVRALPSAGLNAELMESVLVAAGLQLARTRDALEDTELPVPARLARTLLRLGQRFGVVVEDEQVRLTLPLTHDNFAAMIGAARETTTAVLSEMRASGLIQGTRGRYSFNRNQLSDFAAEASF
ncbi:MAG TPA: Crp/Fnr family transcriptional regulator [Trueperaceae bacterium]